jgi:DNA-binding transcriptional ArsR family regulator
MVYRVHFTGQDLARTRVAESPFPLLELTMATRVLQERSQPVRLNAWRRRAFAHLTDPARQALSLIPPVGWSPTFLGPLVAGSSEEALERARATPPGQIRAEMAAIAERQALPGWARHLADDTDLREQVYDAMALLYDALLRPYWARLAPQFAADRALRTRQFLAGGVEHLLTLANPHWMTWNPPVLEIRMANHFENDLYLEGQGVLLVPSLWSTRTIIDNDTRPQPIVIYPVHRVEPLDRLTALIPGPHEVGPAETLPKLLGRTRSAVLNTIAEHPGCTTKELAAIIGTAMANASEHATVLREAGLIHTIRHRNTVLHSPTPLGIALLNGKQGAT